MKEINLSDNPDVSIVLPVYNAERFLAATLDSLVKQLYENFELIIVDDGSTDKSARIIEHFSFDRRIRVIKKEHGGTGSALNAAHEIARGKYITCVATGSVYYPMFLQILRLTLTHSQEQKNPVSLVYGDFEFLDEKGKSNKRVIHQSVDTQKTLMEKYDLGIAMIYTKELWQKTGPYWDGILENYQWAVRAAQYTNFGLIGAVLAGLVIHSQKSPSPVQEKAVADECRTLARELFGGEPLNASLTETLEQGTLPALIQMGEPSSGAPGCAASG